MRKLFLFLLQLVDDQVGQVREVGGDDLVEVLVSLLETVPTLL